MAQATIAGVGINKVNYDSQFSRMPGTSKTYRSLLVLWINNWVATNDTPATKRLLIQF